MTIIYNKEEIKCLIEEIDCQSSINTLKYKEPKFRYQDIPNENVEGTLDKRELEKLMEDTVMEEISSKQEMNVNQEEKCVVEEIDCKQSLSRIGYEKSKVDADVEPVIDAMYNFEKSNSAETCEPIEDISNINTVDTTVVPLTTDYSKYADIAKYFSEFDINNYLSSSIIASVLDSIDKDNTYSTSKVMDENSNETNNSINLIKKKDLVEIENEVENKNEIEAKDEIVAEDEEETKDEMITGRGEKTKNSVRNNILKKVSDVKNYFLKKDLARKILQPRTVYLQNKIGFLGLLSVLGLTGIFTDNKACVGFFGFLYFFRYFFLELNKNFETNLFKAAGIAFFINTVISVTTVVLWLLIDKVILFPFGLGIGMAVSFIAFTVILEVHERKKNV